MADFYRPSQPGCPDQPCLGQQLAFGDVAVVKGQLAGLQVAADQQVVPRRRGGDPRPGVPPFALRALAGRADLPAPRVLCQAFHRFGTGQPRPAGHRDREVRRDPQHVGLALGLKELPQLGAAAVYLVPADEIKGQAVGVAAGADVHGQLSLGAELQVQRQAHDQRRHRVLDVLAGDPLPRPGQRVPGALPHIRQVHRVDPVRHPARAPHVLAFHPGGHLAGLLLAGLVDRPDHQPAPPPATARGFGQAGHREPADLAHRGERVPRCAVQQPLHPVRGAVPGMLGDRPPVPLRQLADQRRHILPGLLPRLGPGKARPQPSDQLSPFPDCLPSPYPGSSSRLRFICPHKHMIARRLRSRHTNPPHPARSSRQWRLPY